MIFSLSKFPFRSFTFSRLLVSYKKILSTYFYSANSFSSVSVGFPFVSGFYCLHAFLSFRINLFKLAFFLNMKIIFAFRTRLSFLSKEKTLYTICYAVVNLLLALPRILTYGNSRVLPALFRFARDSGSLLAFLPSLSPLPTYFFNKSLVGSNGLGPSTSRLSGVCSNQLSYEPVLVEVIGFEPMTPCLQGRCSTN